MLFQTFMTFFRKTQKGDILKSVHAALFQQILVYILSSSKIKL